MEQSGAKSAGAGDSCCGRVLAGKYRLIRVIARGGFGQVYLAQDLHLEKYWAVKEIPKSMAGGIGQIRREAALLGNRQHPGLPVVVDLVEEADACYVVMEYVAGVTLVQAVGQRGVFDRQECIAYMKQLAQILGYLHKQRPPVCYLDMKPENVLLTQEGRLVLVDFGAAMELEGAACNRGACYGTYGYAPPEQCGMTGQQVCDQRSDIYALGATVYFLLTGYDPSRPPFGIRPFEEWEEKAGKKLGRILCTCLMKEPEKRFQTIQELLFELQECRGERSGAWSLCKGVLCRRRFFIRQEKSIFLTEKERVGL